MKPKHICKSNFSSDIAFISILMYNLSNLRMYINITTDYIPHKYLLCSKQGRRKLPIAGWASSINVLQGAQPATSG